MRSQLAHDFVGFNSEYSLCVFVAVNRDDFMLPLHYTFAVSTDLSMPAETFWASQSLATVNLELGPLVRMTFPAEILHQPITSWPQHVQKLKSWILFLGIIPVDRHLFETIQLVGERTFVEQSSSWLSRQWRHERVVQETPAGCRVTDIISFDPRLPILGPLQKAIYLAAFRHRHRVLKQRRGLLRSR